MIGIAALPARFRFRSLKLRIAVVYATLFAAILAAVTLDRRVLVDDLQLFGARDHLDGVTANHGDLREDRAFGFPAFGAAAGMIVRRLRGHLDDHGIGGAVACQGATGKALLGGLGEAPVNCRMQRDRRRREPRRSRRQAVDSGRNEGRAITVRVSRTCFAGAWNGC